MSKDQIYWDDVEVGQELPPMPKIADTQMLVKWAGATGDFNPLHYEDAFAATQGAGGVVVHGRLKRAWLVQFVTTWMGDEGFMRKFSCRFLGWDHPRTMKTMTEPNDGQTWHCTGRVVKKFEDGDHHCVDLEIGVEDGEKKNTTPGTATVILPARSG